MWQFLWPFLLTAAIIGVIASFVYNPLSLSGTIASKAVEASVFGKAKGGFSNKSNNFWIRVNETSGDVVLRARVSQEKGLKLTAVSAYRFNADGSFKERIDAAGAVFVQKNGQNFYTLQDAIITVPGERSRKQEQVDLPVLITQAQLQAGQTNASNVSIWGLSEQVARAEESGKSSLAFKTRFHALLAQPLLFVAMVLLAATISLTFARFGVNGRVILGGVLAGFMLYVLTKLVVTFGSNGLVTPFIAAWSPALVASLISVTMLLHQEDG